MKNKIAWGHMAEDITEPVFFVARQDFLPGKKIGMPAPP